MKKIEGSICEHRKEYFYFEKTQVFPHINQARSLLKDRVVLSLKYSTKNRYTRLLDVISSELEQNQGG